VQGDVVTDIDHGRHRDRATSLGHPRPQPAQETRAPDASGQYHYSHGCHPRASAGGRRALGEAVGWLD
jgi:hypothetical protein